MTLDFIHTLEAEFAKHADAKVAFEQKQYLRGQFEYYGLKTPIRREVQKPFLAKEFLPSKNEMKKIVQTCWEKPQREFHYFGQELALKYAKKLEKEDLPFLEYLITHKSWWDTIDHIATKLVKPYFKKFPELRNTTIDKWLASENMWLQRSSILFMLKDKEQTDLEYLEYVINSLLDSKEFFINKAIGWILRDYSRIDEDWVVDFVERTPLEPLSKREALRLLK